MAKLHFGVIDHPYSYVRQLLTKRGKPRKKSPKVKLSITTGEVAERLEEEYKVMQHFWEDNQIKIGHALDESMEKAIEAVMTGAPVDVDPYAGATSKIQDMFKSYLVSKRLDFREGGVPTKASLEGVNHRLAHPYSKNNPKPRPSFVDTGNYEASFIVYVE